MNLATIEIPTEEAKARLAEYEQALRTERNAEDEAIAAGYRAAARGLPVLRLGEAFDAAGRFDTGLPRLAIARADATTCWVATDGRRALVFGDRQWADNRGALVGRSTVRVNVADELPYFRAHSTIVPSIPPRHRPKRGRLRSHHVLWEVERWDPTPPRDPALLRHIRGDLWAVVATWDLSELERAVLSQRGRL